MTTITENTPTAQDLYNEVYQWVNSRFNFVQLGMLEKMTDHCLYQNIRSVELDYNDFINNYNLRAEFESTVEEDDRNDDTLKEFCEDQDSFESYQDDREGENYPMWNTCFEFRESNATDEMLEAAINAGFGVIENVDFHETILFSSGCGYSFYAAHWIPMYLAMPYNSDDRELYKDVDYSMM